MANTSINNIIACNEPHANLDSYYGPYVSVQAALNALQTVTVSGVNYVKRHIGLTVGIYDTNQVNVTEYWFQGGISDANLVQKGQSSGGGLPFGIKVALFDNNGGTGHQNTLLSDSNGYVILPSCTFTKSGSNFEGWLDNNSNVYQPNQEVYIPNDSITFRAKWSGSTYTVSWEESENISITGEYDGERLSNGASVPSGSNVILTARPESGYEFVAWESIPSGSTPSGTNLSFIVNSNISGIYAIVRKIIGDSYYYSDYNQGCDLYDPSIQMASNKISGNQGTIESNPGSTIVLVVPQGCSATAHFNGRTETFKGIKNFDETFNDYYVKGYVDGDGNAAGDLVRYGKVVLALTGDELRNNNITIKITK